MLLASCQARHAPIQKYDQVVLLDVQGLEGGKDLWIQSDGKAFCRHVAHQKGKSGLQETRYEFTLSEKQRSSLLALINKHGFFSIRTNKRSGVPDEARPCIHVKSGTNVHTVGKWAKDKHGDFDPIYQYLQSVAESGKSGKEFHQGALDWNWKPDGFPENKSIWDAIRSNPK